MPGNTRKKGEVAEKGGKPEMEVAGFEIYVSVCLLLKNKRGCQKKHISQIRKYYPLLASPTPPQPTTSRTLSFFSKTERLLFLLIDHPARPLRRSGLNQRELLLASPDSPSPCASLATLLFLVDRGGEAQRQSRRNAGGAKPGW